MPPLIWTPRALRDISRLFKFLVSKNPPAASRAVHAIRQGAQTLEMHPAIGRPVDDMEPGFREWLIQYGDSGYVVLYRLDGDSVQILAVRHMKEAGYPRPGAPQ